MSQQSKAGTPSPNQSNAGTPVSAATPTSTSHVSNSSPGTAQPKNLSPRLQRKLAKQAKREARESQFLGPAHVDQPRKRQIPPWLVSLTFHLGFLLVLALIPLQQGIQGPLTLSLGMGESESVEFSLTGDSQLEFSLDSSSAATEIQPFEILKVDVQSELTEVTEMGTEPTAVSMPFALANGLAGRQGDSKNALLSRYGGTGETESAVELGLQWLAKQQRMNGSWSMKGPYTKGATLENTTAATALALNAFLGAGYTHQEGKYQDVVRKGLEYLVLKQDSEGFFAAREPSQQFMYAQAIATIAVAEAYGMTEDDWLYGPAGLAISFAEWAQSDAGGWRYDPRDDADLSVTGWYLMALETGKMAGLPVNEQKIKNVTKLLDSLSHEEDSQYAYNLLEDEPRLTMTAEGLLCRIYLGWPSTHPSLLQGIDEQLLRATPAHGDQNYSVYFWYYATQVLHHVGGSHWEKWNRSMRVVLPERQTKEGLEAGSWDPEDDIYGTSGRLYTTCLSIYCLEVYYRHLSIYDLK